MGATTSRTQSPSIPRPRTDAAALQPLEGESLASWIQAVARNRGVETSALFRDLRLYSDDALSRAQTRLTAKTARRLSNETETSEEVLHGMTLARYAGSALPHMPPIPWTDGTVFKQWRTSAWFSDHRARWCTQCLRENDSRWLLQWLLPWSFACLKHRVFLAAECIRCLSPVYFGRHFALDYCLAGGEARLNPYGYAEACDFWVRMHRPLPVTADSVIRHQERVNAWLDGYPSSNDREFVSLTAVLVMLVTPIMLQRRGEDPAILCGLRSGRRTGLIRERGMWADPLRVAAAASVADRLLQRYGASPIEVARYIEGMRCVDWQPQYELDVMDWAYGSALRPNAYVEELVRLGVITICASTRK
ncbi:TniQ family protein [Streptomyces sp. WMMB 322]|uniref:TniQ family protein n=1 Tax=Streptomyces sp. WMMB 322 TaxID=1286821 RepID=UPI00099E3F2E|nr:TniQ family protein [Streptomyces sp. WMMB 322]